MKLYVGNLPHALKEQELHDLFAEHGNVVSAKIIIDHATGRSKGFGFVEMGSREEGMNAINQLNNTDVGGRPVVVNEARPQEKKPFNGERRSFGPRREGGAPRRDNDGGSSFKKRF